METVKNLLGWLFAAGIAGVVVSGALIGCGNATDDGEIGQTDEALLADGPLLYGSDASTFGRCRKDLSANQDCRWQTPSVFAPHDGTTAPAHYQFYVASLGNPDFSATLADANLVASNVNGLIGSSAILDVTSHAVTGPAVNIFPFNRGLVVPGDTLISDYLRIGWSGCGAPELECNPNAGVCPNNIPGIYRACTSTNVSIDTVSLRAAFPAASFAGNLRQLVASGMLISLGMGQQSRGTSYLNPRFDSNAAQNLTNYLQPNERSIADAELHQSSNTWEVVFSF